MITERVAGAIILKDGKVLGAQRGKHKSLPLKWHLPGGKVKIGETLEEALTRELKEELNIIPNSTIDSWDELCNVFVEFSHGKYHVHFFRILGELDGDLKILTDENEAIRWFEYKELDTIVGDEWIQVDKHVAQLALLESH